MDFYSAFKAYFGTMLKRKTRPLPVRLEIYTKFDDRSWGADENGFAAKCREILSGLLPVDLELRIFCWDKKTGGKEFHDRFILTEFGGVDFGHGLDAPGRPGRPSPAKVKIQILDKDDYQELWGDFREDSEVYYKRISDPIIIVGTKTLP